MNFLALSQAPPPVVMEMATNNPVMIEPYIARLPAQFLLRRYTQILGGALLLALLIGTIGFLFPQPLLWLLGPKYAGLQRETSWVVVTACVGYVSGVMWTMHAARRWIFWGGTAAYITLVVLTQVACVLSLDLSRTRDVIWFGLATAVACLCVHVGTGWFGFVRGNDVSSLSRNRGRAL